MKQHYDKPQIYIVTVCQTDVLTASKEGANYPTDWFPKIG